jgi:Flp pilus assembly protein TadG
MHHRGISPAASDDRGSQIMEFAITVPLLVVLVVGIYDFAQAFNTKEKLNFAAKDGARFGAAQPTSDLSQSIPLSVTAIRDLVDADLIAEGIDDCGLGKLQPVAGTLTWTAAANCFSKNNANNPDFTLTIDRGFTIPPASNTSEPWLISTHVTITYPYKWHFQSVITLVAPGANFAGTTALTTDAIVTNQD